MARPSIEIACRLEVLSDLVAAARNDQADLPTVLDAIDRLTKSLRAHAPAADGRPLPKILAQEVALLTT